MKRLLPLLLLALAVPAARGEDPPPAAAEAEAVDLEALRKEYEELREQLFTSRARAAAVGDALYSSRLRVHLKYGSGRFFAVKRATIRLDGANVFDDTAGVIAENDTARFEGFVAPGRHLVTIRLEAVSRDDERVATVTEDSFTIDAPAKKLLVLKARAADDGDLGWTWKRKGKGAYKLRLDVSVESKEPEDAAAR